MVKIKGMNQESKNDFKITNKVVQDNQLIRSVWRMDAVAIKLFQMAIACIDVESPPTDNTVYLSKKDLFHFMGTGSGDKYTRFRDHLRKLQSQVLLIPLKESQKFMSIVPIPTVVFSTKKTDNQIKIVFNSEIMPYLVGLRSNFTQFEIGQLLNIRKKYSLIIFQLAMTHYKLKKTDDPNQIVSFKIALDELRDITDTKNELLLSSNFELRVLKDSINEINNAMTDFLITYEKLKDARRIVAIRFLMRERLSYNDIDFHGPRPINANKWWAAARHLWRC